MGSKSLAQAVDDFATELLLDPEINQVHNDDDFEDIKIGEVVFMRNPYFSDGTRLRLRPERDVAFSGHILNNARCEVLDIVNGYALVNSCDTDDPVKGWVRRRNLTRLKLGRDQGTGKRQGRDDLKATRDANATPPPQRLPPPGSSKYRAGGKGQRARACPPLV